MSPRTIRRIVSGIFVGAIVGMIVGSIADNNGVAVTFGMAGAFAARGLILVTSVGGPDAFCAPVRDDEATAASLDEHIDALVAAGADEEAVRELVREAVRLGRSGR